MLSGNTNDMQETFRVLICEPSEIIATGIVNAIARCQHLENIGQVSTLAEALDKIVRERPDAVIIDPDVPDAVDFEALRQITRLQPGIKMLVLSTRTDKNYVNGCFIAGANGYCMKNIFSLYLVSAIYSVASGAAWLDQQIAGMILPFSQRRSPLSGADIYLSARDVKLLTYICDGMSNKEIAATMNLSQPTVKAHLGTLFRKLGVKDRTEAATHATRENLLRNRAN